MQKERVIYLDIMRVLATFAVVLVHVCAQNWSAASLDSVAWFVFNLGDSAGRWGVPIFLMISGALFLAPEKTLDVRKLYTKNILRIVTAFLFWSVVYTVNAAISKPLTAQEILSRVISGNGHMWFLIMIVGLYIAVPVLRSVCREEKTLRYFLLASFVCNILARTVFNTITPVVENAPVRQVLELLKSNYKTMGLDVVVGYSFYFVLGYYLSTHELTKKERSAAYIGGLLGFAATAVLTHLASAKLGSKYMGFYGDLTLNVMLESIGVFVFVKNRNWRLGERARKAVFALSKWSFGIYLVHELVIGKLARVHISVGAFHPLISVPLVFVSVFAVSALVSAVLNRIPKLNRYIV